MKMNRFILTLPLAIALLSPATGFAKNGSDDAGGDDSRSGGRGSDDNSNNRGGSSQSGNSSRVDIKLRTRLRAAEGVATASNGVAERSLKGKKGRREERLAASVKISIPSTLPALADEAAARALDVRLALSRNGEIYALCTLPLGRIETEIDDSDDSPDLVKAHFRLDLRRREKKGRMRFELRRGVCDTDLTAEGIQSSVPQAVRGDELSVRIGADTTAQAFLVGKF